MFAGENKVKREVVDILSYSKLVHGQVRSLLMSGFCVSNKLHGLRTFPQDLFKYNNEPETAIMTNFLDQFI